MVEASLFEALQKGDFQSIEALLASQPGLVAARDPQGVSFLMHTLYRKQDDRVEKILQGLGRIGVELDVFEASSLGRIARVWELKEQDPETLHSVAGDGFAPLHLAAFFSRTEVVEFLLGEGISPDVVAGNPTELRPLHSAVASGCIEAVSKLLSAGAEVDSRQAGGFTALMGAAAGGHLEIVELLLAAGADRQLESDQGQTAYSLASERGHELLLESLAI